MSFPTPRLILISHTLIALTKTRFSGEWIAPRKELDSIGPSWSHHSQTWVSRSRFNWPFVEKILQLLIRRIEVGRNPNPSLHRPRLSRLPCGYGNESSHRLTGSGYDDFLSVLYNHQESGEFGLRLAHVARCHIRKDVVWSGLVERNLVKTRVLSVSHDPRQSPMWKGWGGPDPVTTLKSAWYRWNLFASTVPFVS